MAFCDFGNSLHFRTPPKSPGKYLLARANILPPYPLVSSSTLSLLQGTLTFKNILQDNHFRQIAKKIPQMHQLNRLRDISQHLTQLHAHTKEEVLLPWNKNALLALCNPDTCVTPRVVFTRSSSVIMSNWRSGSVPIPITAKKPRTVLA